MSESPKSSEFVTAWALPNVGARSEDIDAGEVSPPTADEIAAWEDEARAKGYREGEQAGHAEGYQAGFDQGSVDVNTRIELLSQMVTAFEEPFADLDERVEKEMESLIVTLAQQLVRREIRSEPGEIVGVIRESMALLPANKQHVAIHLHPEDATLLREVLATSDSENNWALNEDPLISRGGCQINTETSRIDTTIEARLAALAATMFGGEREGD